MMEHSLAAAILVYFILIESRSFEANDDCVSQKFVCTNVSIVGNLS